MSSTSGSSSITRRRQQNEGHVPVNVIRLRYTGALDGAEGQLRTPGRFILRVEPGYMLENRLGGTQSRSGRFGGKTNLLLLSDSEPRMVRAFDRSLHRLNQSRRPTSGPAG